MDFTDAFHIFDIAVVNSWLEYKRDATDLEIPSKDIIDLIYFKQRLAESLIRIGTKQSGRFSNSPSVNVFHPRQQHVDKKPLEEVRKDQLSHYPEYDDRVEAIRCKYEDCTGRTHVYCVKCNCHLCFTKKKNCFRKFHE